MSDRYAGVFSDPLHFQQGEARLIGLVDSVRGDYQAGKFAGNGRINVFSAATGRFVTELKNAQDKPIQIDGLWALQPGNGSAGTDANTIYFSAGPNHEKHGLFGTLTADAT